MWQDWVISIVQWWFVITLIPTIRDKTQKPALMTGVSATIGLYVIAFANATLDLWAASLSSAILASLWALLAYQRWRLDHSKGRAGLG